MLGLGLGLGLGLAVLLRAKAAVPTQLAPLRLQPPRQLGAQPAAQRRPVDRRSDHTRPAEATRRVVDARGRRAVAARRRLKQLLEAARAARARGLAWVALGIGLGWGWG